MILPRAAAARIRNHVKPVARRAFYALRNHLPRRPFVGSARYWQTRYESGGDSGPGSRGRLADFKAGFINEFVRQHEITSVIELGCGDGGQLTGAEYPKYLGIDVSNTAIESCSRRFRNDPTKRFMLLEDLPAGTTAQLALSIDVIYHLVEDEIFEHHLELMDQVAERFAILYTSAKDTPADPARHVRHRDIEREVRRLLPRWRLVEHRPNPYPWLPGDPTTSFADFFVYATHS